MVEFPSQSPQTREISSSSDERRLGSPCSRASSRRTWPICLPAITINRRLTRLFVHITDPYLGLQCATMEGRTSRAETVLRVVQSHTLQLCSVQWCLVQCSVVQCSLVQCSVVQCGTGQCNAVQCNAVQCSAPHPSPFQKTLPSPLLVAM